MGSNASMWRDSRRYCRESGDQLAAWPARMRASRAMMAGVVGMGGVLLKVGVIISAEGPAGKPKNRRDRLRYPLMPLSQGSARCS